MKLEWLILGEGVTQDARGAFTMVGLNQNVFASERLPAQTKRVVLSRLSGLEPGEQVGFHVSVLSPTGRVVAAQQGQFTVQGKRFRDLPATGVDIPVEFIIGLDDYGDYRFVVEVKDVATGETETSSAELFVVRPSDLVEEEPPASAGA